MGKTCRKIYFLFAILLIAGKISAQQFSGIVQDAENKQKLAGVAVSLLDKDSLMTGYGFSKDDGSFSLTNNSGSAAVYLRFHCLAYEQKTMPLSKFKNGDIVELKNTVFQIKEFTVRSKRVEERNDTLIYSVAGYSMPQDRSIADVIAKIPGFEIKPSGQIEYDGKPINKFYIENMDLMEDKYTMASNNLSRKKVKEVEVFRNHQPIDVLRGKSFSDQAAVNLVLEEDAKFAFSGITDIGLGFGEEFLYKNRIMGMLFGKKHQNLSLYKNDNTGENLITEVQRVSLGSGASIITYKTDQDNNLINSINIPSPSIHRERYVFNKSHLFATNHLVRNKKNNDFKTQISYFFDDLDRENFMQTRYLHFGDGEIISENSRLENKKHLFDVSINYESNKKTGYFNNKLIGKLDFHTSTGSSLLNNSLTKLWAKPDRKYISDELKFIRSLKNDRLLSLSSVNFINYLPQKLLIFSGNDQYTAMSHFSSSTDTYFQHRFLGFYIRYQAGLDIDLQKLSAPDIQESTKTYAKIFNTINPYLDPSLSFKKNDWELKANVKLGLLNVSYNTKANPNRINNSFFLPEPQLRAVYQLSGSSKLTASYRYTYSSPGVKDFYDMEFFTSYRTAIVNDLDFYINKRHHFSLSYAYIRPIKGIHFSLNVSYGINNKRILYENIQKNEILITKGIEQNYQASTSMLISRFAKSFNFWKSLFSINATFMKNHDANFVNQKISDYDFYSLFSEINFSSRPARFLSTELKSFVSHNQVDMRNTVNSNTSFNHTLDLNFIFHKKFSFLVTNTYFHSLDKEIDSALFLDLSANYQYKNFEFKLSANNIVGKSFYEQHNISSLEESFIMYKIRPREFVLSASFTF